MISSDPAHSRYWFHVARKNKIVRADGMSSPMRGSTTAILDPGRPRLWMS
jgi:hypothetical protein